VTVLGILFLLLLGIHVAVTLKTAGRARPDTGSVPLSTFVFDAAPFVVVCCSGRKRETKKTILGAYLQVAVFVMACYFGYRQGVFSRQLVSPVHIGLGLLAGHLIFGASLLVTQQSLRAAADHFIDFRALWNFMIESPAVLFQFISVSIAEEMIYRVSLQPLLTAWMGSAVLSIALVAIVFSCVHEHFFRNGFVQSSEFMGFALLLGVLYYWTGSVILVIVIHAVRNMEIAFLEYLVRVDETESEEIAQRECEFLAGERLAVFVVAPARDPFAAYLEYTAWTEAPSHGSVASAPRTPAKACRHMEFS
jgi:membrane protease YdiL (CAAX protease family)